MKNILIKIRDVGFIVFGALIIIPWALINWSKIDFRLEGRNLSEGQDGNFYLIAILIGIAMILYGVFNFQIRNSKHTTRDTDMGK